MADLGHLIRLDKSRINAGADLLSRAFYDDPVFVYFVPDDKERQKKAHFIHRMLVRYSIAYGEVYATSPDFEGVAVWLPSEKVQMTFWRGLMSGGLPIPSTVRQLTASDVMCKVHRRHAG